MSALKTIISLLLILSFIGCKSVDLEMYRSPELSNGQKIEYLLSIMTLEEKLGQMTQIDENGIENRNDIKNYFLGSVLSGGGSDPADNMPETWADMYDEFQGYALETRLGIPLIYGVDAVHGHNNIYGATIFPHNIGLGATRDAALVEEIARITALEVAGTGMDWTFSPCIAVPQNERWGRTYEGFSEDPELVNELGKAAVRGYQGSDLSLPETIMASSKHFVADGGTYNGIDRGNAKMDEEELRNIHLFPYVGAIEENVGTIMASFSSWNGDKMHAHDYLLTEVLRDEMGFKGFVISDWDALELMRGTYDEQIVDAVNAGVDMIMLSNGYVKFLQSLERSVKSGAISMDRIDEAVGRILKAKFDLNLFEKPLTDRSYTSLIGSEEHRNVARDAVRKSLVLLKNENNILPLDKNLEEIYVAGRNSKNLAAQTGGWTIGWQGERGNDFTIGTNILTAIESAVSENTEVFYSRTGDKFESSSGIAIVVIGEEPYAEMMGDVKDLKISRNDLNTVKNLKEQGFTVITVLISGRPMIINEVLEYSDAFVAAWLPGTEGNGVTDVLFGDYAPTGKLGHTWPANMAQIPINRNSEHVAEALFQFGYGLTY